MPSLQRKRSLFSLCTHGNKIFVLGGGSASCEMMDLSEDNPQWRSIANMNGGYHGGGAVVMGDKIYALGGDYNASKVEVYDIDQGMSFRL